MMHARTYLWFVFMSLMHILWTYEMFCHNDMFCSIKGDQKKTSPLMFWFIASVIIIRSEWDAYQIKHLGLTILKCTVTFSSCKYFWRYCRGKTACPKFLPTRVRPLKDNSALFKIVSVLCFDL